MIVPAVVEGDLVATVRGVWQRMDQVRITRGPLLKVECSCGAGGYCQHVGAVVLQWIRDRSSFVDPVAWTNQGGRPALSPQFFPGPGRDAGLSATDETRVAEIERFLQVPTMTALRESGQRRQANIPKSRGKGDLINLLAPILASPVNVDSALGRLDIEEWLALDAVYLDGPGNRTTLSAVTTVYRALGGTEKDPRVGILVDSGLVFGNADRYDLRRATAERLPLLEELALAGGSATARAVYRQLLEQRVIIEADPTLWSSYRARRGSPWKRGSNQLEDVAARLAVLRLAFSADASRGRSNDLADLGDRLFIPKEILPLIPVPEVLVEFAPEPSAVQVAAPEALLRDVYELIRSAAEAPIPLTAWRQIVKRALVRLNQDLQIPENVVSARSEDDLSRLPFLRARSEDLQLIEARASTLIVGPGAEKFLSTPRNARLRDLFEAYRRTRRWCELFHVPDLTISTSGGTAREAPEVVVQAREHLIRQIALLPLERWITRSHLVDRLKRRSFEFLFSRASVPARYRGDDSYWDNVYEGDNALGRDIRIDGEAPEWEDVEGGFIDQVIDALHWLGVVDLGEVASRESAFRLTPQGSLLLHGNALPPIDEAPDVVVQPNFQIFALPPTGEDVLFRLDQFAERARVDRAVEYRLTHASVDRAQQHDLSTAQIIAFPDRISRTRRRRASPRDPERPRNGSPRPSPRALEFVRRQQSSRISAEERHEPA